MQLPRLQNFSLAMRLSLFGTVALLVGVFVTVNNAMQNQENRSHASTVVTLKPTDDTYIDASVPSTIYGNGGLILADGNPQRVILMKFNLGAIPVGATITSASLKVTAGSNNGTTQTYPIYLMSTNNWTEATTWNTKPAYTGTLIGNVGPVASGATTTVTLANAPLSAKAGQVVSFYVQDFTKTDGLGLTSSESTTPPQLIITYNVAATATPTTAPTVRPTATSVPPTPTPTTAPAANIIANPGCETDMSGLYGYAATISRTTSYHHTGIAACEVKYASGTFYDIAVTKTVPSPAQGSKYTGQAYVRKTSSGTNAGKKVYVAIREQGGANPSRTTYGNPVLLSDTWQLVTNTMTVQSAGRTSLDYYVVQDGGPAAGDQFIVDDMSWALSSVASTPTPTPSPTPAAKPDLVVTNMQISYQNRSGSFICSDGLGVVITVKNAGNAPISAPIAVKSNNTTVTLLSGLAAGESKDMWMKDYANPNTVIVDPNNTIIESNETNNTLTEPLAVPTQPAQCTNPTATNTPVPPTPTSFPTDVPTPTQQPTETPAPTDTPVPGSTMFAMTLVLHGLGNGGDNVNPTGKGNMTPLHDQRTATVEVYDSHNNLVQTQQGTVTFDTASGYFKGVIDMGSAIASGVYNIKVKTDQFLKTLVPGIQTISAGNTNQLPNVALVNGDINNDNAINILDYNLLMGCYSELSAPVSCAPGDEVKADLNDDGAVNSFDYNLFLRELTNRTGQ